MTENKKTKIISVALALFVSSGLSGNALAAPSITNVSGTATHGSSVTISGSGFGTNASPAPLVFDRLDSGFSPVWESTGGDCADPPHPVFNIVTSNPRHVRDSHSAYANMNRCMNAAVTYPDEIATLYAQYWVRLGNNFIFQPLEGEMSLGNIKIFRMWSRMDYPSPNFAVAMHGAGASVISQSEYVSPGVDYEWGTSINGLLTRNTWHLFQFQYKESSPGDFDGALYFWVDNVLVSVRTGINTRETGHPTKYPLIIGWFNSGSSGGTTSDFQLDDFYLDDTWQRIEIGNNSNYNNCTQKEIQPPIAWSASSATITLNQGSFADGVTAYVFLTDASGVRNSIGYPITFGSGSGNILSPNSPGGLSVR